jgi:hypothetical protein
LIFDPSTERLYAQSQRQFQKFVPQLLAITAGYRARETRSLTQLETISAEKTLEFVLFDIHLVGRQCRDFKLD